MKKTNKILLWTLCFLFVLFFIAFATLPTFLSTSFGTRTLVNCINKHSNKTLAIKELSLSWFGTQRVKNLVLKDEKGSTLFSFQSFDTETSLIYLLLGGRSLSKTVLEEPYLHLAKIKKEFAKEKKEQKSARKHKTNNFVGFDRTLHVFRGSVIFTSDNFTPITLSDISISKTSDHLTLQASTSFGSILGSLFVDASLNQTTHANVTLDNFPLAILDTVCDSKLYSEALGPTLNLNLNILRDESRAVAVKGLIQSSNLSATIEGVTEQDQFVLLPQTHLDFVITPSFFKQLLNEKQRGDWELASKTTLNLQIEKIAFPLSRPFELGSLIAQGKATVSRAELHHKTVGSYSLKNMEAFANKDTNLQLHLQTDIQGNESTKLSGSFSITPDGKCQFDYNCLGFPVTLFELFSDTLTEKIKLIFGNQLDIQGEGTLLSKQINSHFSLKSRAAQISGQLTGHFPEMNFELSGMRKIQGNATKVLGNSINFTVNGLAKFQDNSFSVPYLGGTLFNSHLECDIRGQMGEDAFTLDTLHLIAIGKIKQLPFEENFAEAALQNGTFFLKIDGAQNLITAKVESRSVDATLDVQNFLQNGEISSDQANTLFSCSLKDFPVEELRPLISEDIDFKALFGAHLFLSFKGNYAPSQTPTLTLDLNAKGLGFSSSLSITVDQQRIVRQNKPSYVYWEITPERYEALQRLFNVNSQYQPTFVLTRPTQLEFNITQFSCPTTTADNLGHFLCQSGFVGDLKLGATTFRSQLTNETISFQDITGSVKGENFSQAIDLSLSGNILAANIPKSENSSFAFTGQMFNFWSKAGKFNREGLTVKGELNLHLLPVRQITEMVPIDHETRAVTQAVLGDFVNAHISGQISQLQGPIHIDVKSSNFKAKLPLQLHHNALYLRDYVDAEISLTEAVNETLLKDINPLLITGAYSDHPLKVYIDPEGFVLPIKPYSLEQVQIGKAIFDIGKIRVRNGGQIHTLMEFLNAKEITPDGFMEAWFTPIFMDLHHGVASYKRFDALLAGNVHIALWGSINLINEQVNMTLAIAPTTLYQRFKISGLAKTDMFQVLMRGTTSKLELDWSAAYTRIAGIVARSRLGPLVGGIVEQFIGTADNQPAPAPTTDPLPWESQYPSEPTSKQSPEQRNGAKQWLKNLLP